MERVKQLVTRAAATVAKMNQALRDVRSVALVVSRDHRRPRWEGSLDLHTGVITERNVEVIYMKREEIISIRF